MSSSTVHLLVIATIASSMAVLLVAGLRKPLRYAVGARAAYWLWLIVPASVLAVLLPAPVYPDRALNVPLPHSVGAAYAAAVVSVNSSAVSNHEVPAIAIWSLGVFCMLCRVVRRQHTFIRSLGILKQDSNGLYRSNSAVAPLLLGAWRGRIVVPTDFEVRYSAEERTLMLAHERAHQGRRDAAINVFATLWLCLFWFNPLMYWALEQLRFDQELACDALVIARLKSHRRLYADTLLKTQLANESTWPKPVGCHWQSSHPLKERVAMLKYPSPGLVRRLAGIAFSFALTLTGSYAIWAAQPEVAMPVSSERLIAINMKWWVNGAEMLQPGGPSAARDIRVASGKEFVRKISFGEGYAYETQCVASLSNADKKSPVWKTAESMGQHTAGLILLECKLLQNGKVFATPAVLTKDSEAATVETVNRDGSAHVKLEFNASTLPARIADAQ